MSCHCPLLPGCKFHGDPRSSVDAGLGGMKRGARRVWACSREGERDTHTCTFILIASVLLFLCFSICTLTEDKTPINIKDCECIVDTLLRFVNGGGSGYFIYLMLLTVSLTRKRAEEVGLTGLSPASLGAPPYTSSPTRALSCLLRKST